MSLTKVTYSMVNGAVVNVLDYGADPTGVADSTTAIQNAINSFPSGNGAIYIPTGEYKVTSTITIAQNGIRLFGDGNKQSVIAFVPTAPDTCIYASRGANVLYNCTIEKLGFAGGTSFKKIALELSDFSTSTFRDIEIRNWYNNGSVGIQTLGRDTSQFQNLRIDADLPIQISQNPNYTIDCNEIVFRDMYITANDATGACIKADDGVYFTGLTFEGYQSWVHGKYGFYYNNTINSTASQKISFNNIWKEQTDDITGYIVYINQTVGTIQGVTFKDCHGDSSCNGYYLRKVLNATFLNSNYTGLNEAINVDGTVLNLSFVNFQARATSTATLTNQRLMAAFSRFATSAPFADTSFYVSTDSLANPQFSLLYNVRTPLVQITDGVSTPATETGFATLYVDTADGDLKIKFGDGTVKTIVTDT